MKCSDISDDDHLFNGTVNTVNSVAKLINFAVGNLTVTLKKPSWRSTVDRIYAAT